MMKNVFYFMLKSLFVFKVFKYIYRCLNYEHVEKMATLER